MPVQFSNHLDLQGVNRIQNLPAPAASNDAVRKQDLDSAIEGLASKDSCRVATQGNLNLASPGANIDGIAMAAGDRVLVKAQTAPPENGIYIWNGAAAAATRSLDANVSDELEQAITSVEEGTDAGVTFRQTSVNFVLNTGAVSWVGFGLGVPAASTGTPGIAALATQAEVDAGAATNKIVTPQTLANSANRKQKAVATIGDGSATQFDITHNFNTRDVTIAAYYATTPWATFIPDSSRPDANTARLNFSVAPAANSVRVVVMS
jgi:hypothetical protein